VKQFRICGFVLALTACAAEPPPPPAENLLPGRFLAEYGPAIPTFEAFRAGLIANRFLDTIATRLNDSLALPLDITLATAHCDEPNAAYDPGMRRVTLCYELFKSLADRFRTTPGQEYVVPGTIMFALMHETGHALVDVLALPVTGREEDAVDQLATKLLLEQGALTIHRLRRGWLVVTSARRGASTAWPRGRPVSTAGLRPDLLDRAGLRADIGDRRRWLPQQIAKGCR
jgi:hypothetical protein